MDRQSRQDPRTLAAPGPRPLLRERKAARGDQAGTVHIRTLEGSVHTQPPPPPPCGQQRRVPSLTAGVQALPGPAGSEGSPRTWPARVGGRGQREPRDVAAGQAPS